MNIWVDHLQIQYTQDHLQIQICITIFGWTTPVRIFEPRRFCSCVGWRGTRDPEDLCLAQGGGLRPGEVGQFHFSTAINPGSSPAPAPRQAARADPLVERLKDGGGGGPPAEHLRPGRQVLRRHHVPPRSQGRLASPEAVTPPPEDVYTIIIK